MNPFIETSEESETRELQLQNERMRWLLRQIVNDLPERRDWLNPEYEKEARIWGNTRMTIYYVNISYRKGGNQELRGLSFSTFEKACEALEEDVRRRYPNADALNRKFGGDFTKGVFHSEEEMLEVRALNT